MNEQLDYALSLIDEALREDPSRDGEDSELTSAFVYGRRMSDWLQRLCPQPSEALVLAARGQHFRRWEIPRDRYPEGRAGYLAWRTFLYGYQAERLAEALRQAGYDEETVQRAAALVAKRRLKQDREAQTLEDVACLVFLKFEFERFAAAYPEEKTIAILRKTWGKMSPAGQAAALTLALPASLARLVAEALGKTSACSPEA